MVHKIALSAVITAQLLIHSPIALADSGSKINQRSHIENESKNKLTLFRIKAGLVLPKSDQVIANRSKSDGRCQLSIGNRVGSGGLANEEISVFIMGPVINYCK